MKRYFLFLAVFAISISSISADELMENLKDASEQVAHDLNEFLSDDTLYSGAIKLGSKPVVMGDLFSDLLANRLLMSSGFEGSVIKGHSPGENRLADADWVLSGSLYKTGANYFLSMYLNDSVGLQKWGWEFLIPVEGSDSLLEPSAMAIAFGGDIYEPNNSSSSAVELNPDPEVEMTGLEIGESGDEDWFYIDIDQISTETSTYLLSAYTQGGLDTYMELYSPSSSTSSVVENDDGDDGNARISYVITETGRWYINVRGYSTDETGDYSLVVSMEMREPGPGEPDNDMENASILEVDGAELSRSADYGDDYDYFKIILNSSIPEDKALVLQTYSDLDLTMTFLDSYDTEVVSNDDSGQDGNPMIMLPAQHEGTWYVAVYPYDDENIGSYTIRAFLIDVEKDEYENDDSMESSSLIEVNGPEQIRTFMPANEEDWIKFTADETKEYMIKTTGPIDTKLTLYDRRGEYLYEDDDSGNDNNALISETLNEGIYYIQVTQYESDGNVEDEYSISVRKF